MWLFNRSCWLHRSTIYPCYTSLTELESIERPFGLTIERDLYFQQKWMSEVK
ncbi:MAG: DUF2958 domain-containing protein [Deltaproteobacteria bacterium]|nr:DUF2958 domain-containing protein [Deltaproteobacteria bacterium]MBT4269563.1 DUF2958 domain-containing protein [Deltaproteobacteria bacterium]MBT4638576.1 DUF2958 domain-containing protein [Deltaproteobacteria bacterium]MBT6612957.1 DUF2958 domain-containing protein [Deltaproteobacteria bacterium]MBT7711943.1 DUF2958 domain-containing protein [Deltaproteobacteria bacterium]